MLDDIEPELLADRPTESFHGRQGAYTTMRMFYRSLRGDDDEASRWAEELARGLDSASGADPVSRTGWYQFLAMTYSEAVQVDYVIDALERLVAEPGFITLRQSNHTRRSTLFVTIHAISN